jgi:hypothetical protein
LNQEQALRGYLLYELCFYIRNQLLPAPVNFILGIEKGAPFAVSERLKGLDLFLAGQLVLQTEGQGGRPFGLFDLSVHVLDLPFEGHLQVIGPTVQFFRLYFEEFDRAEKTSPVIPDAIVCED